MLAFAKRYIAEISEGAPPNEHVHVVYSRTTCGPLSYPRLVSAHCPEHLGRQAVAGVLLHDLSHLPGAPQPLPLAPGVAGHHYVAAPSIALFNLATPVSLQYIGHFFGVGKATSGEAILEVCGAL